MDYNNRMQREKGHQHHPGGQRARRPKYIIDVIICETWKPCFCICWKSHTIAYTASRIMNAIRWNAQFSWGRSSAPRKDRIDFLRTLPFERQRTAFVPCNWFAPGPWQKIHWTSEEQRRAHGWAEIIHQILKWIFFFWEMREQRNCVATNMHLCIEPSTTWTKYIFRLSTSVIATSSLWIWLVVHQKRGSFVRCNGNFVPFNFFD